MTGQRAPGPLRVSREAREQLARHAAAALPREACGVLVGVRGPRGAQVKLGTRGRNRAPARDRFELDPRDLLRAEEVAAAAGLAVLGVWHSHPTAPAVPSARDCAGAWPGWSHVIVSLANERVAELRAWVVEDDALLEQEVST